MDSNFAAMKWSKVPDEGGWMKGIFIHYNGRVLAVDSNNKLYTRAHLDGEMEGSAR